VSNISPIPWRVEHSRDVFDTYRRYIVDANGNRICSMYHKDFCDYATCMPDAEYIVKCVNEYKSIVAERDLWRSKFILGEETNDKIVESMTDVMDKLCEENDGLVKGFEEIKQELETEVVNHGYTTALSKSLLNANEKLKQDIEESKAEIAKLKFEINTLKNDNTELLIAFTDSITRQGG
jgi:hypothetical protein